MLKSFNQDPNIAIHCEKVSKKFYYDEHRIRSLREAFIRFVKQQAPEKKEPIFDLQDFNMTVKRGKVTALIGTNGSGKSTALRLLAGIYEPTSGQIHFRGRSAAVIELGAGFNHELNGRENINLYGSLMGLTRAEIKTHYQEILEFSEVGKFIDVPVKLYSSGMRARLAFSVTLSLKPDILLLDEVLSVGDWAFRKKCAEKLRSFVASGGTLVMATHDLDEVRELATHVIWLKNGIVHQTGSPEEVLEHYTDSDDDDD